MDASHILLSDQWSVTDPTAFDAFGEEWQIVQEPPPPSINTRPPTTAQTPTRPDPTKTLTDFIKKLVIVTMTCANLT